MYAPRHPDASVPPPRFPLNPLDLIDEDRIAQSLFAATRQLGHPDPFLAREIADGVCHFLREATPPESESELRELVTAHVRSLGQPVLASVIENRGIDPLPRYSTDDPRPVRTEAYPSNVVAAHEAGLIHIHQFDESDRLVGGLAELPPIGAGEAGWRECIARAARRFSRFVVFDRVEDALANVPVDEWQRWVEESLREHSLTAVLHLNRHSDHVTGPLFRTPQPSLWPEDASAINSRITDLPTWGNARVVWWHDGDRLLLADRLRRASRWGQLEIAIRPGGKERVWATGLPMSCSAVVLQVDLSLTALREHLPTSLDEVEFVERVGSLARLGMAAGHARKLHLRYHRPDLRKGFLIDRSSLAVTVSGLDQFPRSATEITRRLVAALDTDPHGMAAVLVQPPPVVDLGRGANPFLEDTCGKAQSGDDRRADGDEWLERTLFLEKSIQSLAVVQVRCHF